MPYLFLNSCGLIIPTLPAKYIFVCKCWKCLCLKRRHDKFWPWFVMADWHTWIYTWFVMWAVILLNLNDLKSRRILISGPLWTWSLIVTPSTLLGSAMAVASILSSLVIHKLYQDDRDIKNLFWAGFAVRAEKELQTLKHLIFYKIFSASLSWRISEKERGRKTEACKTF